jgi:uncharacterized short protein YbdD (DUF466 family)
MDKLIIQDDYDDITETYLKHIIVKNPSQNVMSYDTAYKFYKKLEKEGYKNVKVVGTNRYQKYFTLKSINGDFQTEDDYLKDKPQEIRDKFNGFYQYYISYTE